MPARINPFDSDTARIARSAQDDPWVMYFVVRKDSPLTLAQAMTMVGAGAVGCAQTWRQTDRWAQPFALWQQRSYRKVALRASEHQLKTLAGQLDGVTITTGGGPALLCLPPRRKSARETLLAKLQAYTDAPCPRRAAAAAGVVRSAAALPGARPGDEEHGQGDGAGRPRRTEGLRPARRPPRARVRAPVRGRPARRSARRRRLHMGARNASSTAWSCATPASRKWRPAPRPWSRSLPASNPTRSWPHLPSCAEPDPAAHQSPGCVRGHSSPPLPSTL